MEPLRPWKADQLGSGYLVSSWIEKTAVEAAHRVIAVSHKMREDILAHFNADPARVVVIHNGIDPDQLPAHRAAATRSSGSACARPTCSSSGASPTRRGSSTCWRRRAQLPAGVQVVLCASAPDTPEIEERLRRAVAGQPNVKWINEMVPVDVVTQLYSHAAVFCCPSVYEPFGLINLEAMACETPVVASAVGGILEVVEDGKTGLLVPPASPAALAAALTRVLGNPALARAMGQAGRRRVEEQFCWASRGRAHRAGLRRRDRGVQAVVGRLSAVLADCRGFVFDLDGCVWQGDVLNPGAGETLTALHRRGPRRRLPHQQLARHRRRHPRQAPPARRDLGRARADAARDPRPGRSPSASVPRACW